MNLATAWSIGLLGTRGVPVEVEVAIGGGLPRTILVGLPDTSLYEARDRCKAAVSCAQLDWPDQLVTINLTPATLPKGGSHYDLAIVGAVLAAAKKVPATGLANSVLLGELGLDGRVRVVRGLLPAVLAARDVGLQRALVPWEQVGEARLVDGIEVVGVASLADLVVVLRGGEIDRPPAAAPEQDQSPQPKDLLDVAGHADARWALEIAAAGRHHIYFHGPPGAGKTLLAERLPSILPELEPEQAIEVAAIRSLAGHSLEWGLSTVPPFSNPHHSATVASLVGGGARMALPGAISLAHRGVLFLDEAPEFSPRALEALRVPLESGQVTLTRATSQVTYPARFQLVLAANPCPCGMSTTAGASCKCAPMTIRRYAERLSGPILDRVDIQQHLRPLKRAYLRVTEAESSAQVAERVRAARERQRRRFDGLPWHTNGEIPGGYLRRNLCPRGSIDLLDRAVARGQLSARGVDKVIRVAWTIADLTGRDAPAETEVHTALMLRQGQELGGVA